MREIKPGKEALIAAVSWSSGMGAVLDVRGHILNDTLCEEGAGGIPLFEIGDHPDGSLVIFEVESITRDGEGGFDLSTGGWRDLTQEEWELAVKGDLAAILTQLCPEKAVEKPPEPSLGVFPCLYKRNPLEGMLGNLPWAGLAAS